MRLASIAFVAGLLLASAASAHGPKIGPNGGAHVEAGAYHVEIVAKGTTLTVYLGDANDKAIASSGHKATAIRFGSSAD